WSGGRNPRLRYRGSLTLAIKQGLKTISFPSISTGAYSYPVDQAARVALGEVISTIERETGLEEVRFVLFDNWTFQSYASVLNELAKEKGLKARKQASSAD
ncbi:MAG: macro domain-containing protein, partial [Dehalococcoidia bacterium]